MPKAKLSEIRGRAPSIRRITGSANVPLNDAGRKQAKQLAQKGPFDRVNSSPRDRAMETARLTLPQAKADRSLDAWKLGAHEGKPAESERGAVNARISKRPYVPTGKSEFSGERGESFRQFQRRYIAGAQTRREALKPGEKVLNVTHGRNLRLHEAWMKKGAPADGSVDVKHMTGDGEWSKTGDLFFENEKTNTLDPMERASKPGNYYARHGETEWNAG
jgi:broad specificity phosphatase PhoE